MTFIRRKSQTLEENYSFSIYKEAHLPMSHAHAARLITQIVIKYKGDKDKINYEAKKVRDYYFNQNN